MCFKFFFFYFTGAHHIPVSSFCNYMSLCFSPFVWVFWLHNPSHTHSFIRSVRFSQKKTFLWILLSFFFCSRWQKFHLILCFKLFVFCFIFCECVWFVRFWCGFHRFLAIRSFVNLCSRFIALYFFCSNWHTGRFRANFREGIFTFFFLHQFGEGFRKPLNWFECKNMLFFRQGVQDSSDLLFFYRFVSFFCLRVVFF